MKRTSRNKRLRGVAALTMGVFAGLSRLHLLPASAFVGYAGLIAGVFVGLGVSKHEPVSHDSVGAASAGTAVYIAVLVVGGQFGLYSLPVSTVPPGLEALGPLLEPVLFLPLFVVEALVIAVLAKTVRTRTVAAYESG